MHISSLYRFQKSLCCSLVFLLVLMVSGVGYFAPVANAAASAWEDLNPDPAGTEDFNYELYIIAHGNGEWFTTGTTFLGYSTNGTTWVHPEESTVVDSELINSVAYAGDRWVAAGQSGAILTSPVSPANPLTSWTLHAGGAGTGTSENLWDVAYGEDSGGSPLTILTGENGTIVTSADNVNWNSAPTKGDGSYLMAAASGNGSFVAAGYDSGFATGVVYYSNDGVTFSAGTIGSGINDVVYAEGKFVAVGDGGYIATSTNGQTWTPRTNPSGGSDDLLGIAYGTGKFVAVGDNGDIVSSEDGMIWASETPKTTGDFDSVAYGDNRFVIVGPAGLMQTAADPNSIISPTTGSFDKKATAQADVTTTMTLNGNSIASIVNGGASLTEGTDYTVSGSTVTIKKEYLAAQPSGTTTLTFNFSAGATQTLTITVTDTTPRINPTTGSFDKKTSAQANVTTTMTLNGHTLNSITNGGATLTANTDYTVSGSTVTIKKEYLATQPEGTTNLTFNFNGAMTQTIAITVVDTTPQNSTISPTTGGFDKKTTAQADVTTTMTLKGNMFSSITNGAATLQAGTDYTVTGGTNVAIRKEYLASQPIGTTTLTFNFSAGLTQTLTISITDTTPTISPTSGSFDKKTTVQTDVTTTMTLNSHTLTNIANGGAALVADTDYTVSGNTITIKKDYLATQPVGTTSLIFNFSGAMTQTLTIAVNDTTPTINPTSGSFDKMTNAQSDVSTVMTFNSHTLTGIANGGAALVADTDYTVSGNTVTIKKDYLAAQPVGTTTLSFAFSGGITKTLAITVNDTTPVISPTTGSFDKITSAQSDVTTTMTLNGHTLGSITNGGSTLSASTDYSVSGNTVTIKKEYLAAQPLGTTTLTLQFSSGTSQTIAITVSDTTPTISPETGSFDKKTSLQADVTTIMALNGHTLSSIVNGGTTLEANTDYTVSGGTTVTIKKEYLALQSVGTTTLTFNFSGGISQALTITISDTSPTINPTTGSFDKKTSAMADVTTSMTLNGHTVNGISNGGSTLIADTDYTVSGSIVTIKKEYLAGQPVGTTSLTIQFSGGFAQTLTITISDTTPTISPATGSFDKMSTAQADVTTTMTLNGHTLSSIANGGSTLVAGTDYTVFGGTTITIKKEYLAAQPIGTTSLTFTFSGGITRTLTVSVMDTTPVISPTTGSFDKLASAQADVMSTMTLNGHTLNSITNGGETLAAVTDYTVSSGTTVTIKKEYLAAQTVGITSLVFHFSSGTTRTLEITVSDTTPIISPATGSFDKKTTAWADVTTTMTLNGHTLSSIANGGVSLVANTDYTVSGNALTIKKEYMATQPVGSTNLTLHFSSGTSLLLTITVSDTTPIITPSTGNFDRKTSAQADVTTVMTLNGHTLNSIANGVTTLVANTDYTVTGSTVMIKMEYLAKQPVGTTTLTFTFSGGITQTLVIAIRHTTRPPTTPEIPTVGVEVLVNEKVVIAGTATTASIDGRTVTTLAVDSQRLDEKLQGEGLFPTITILAGNSTSDIVIGELDGQLIKILEQKKAVLKMKTEQAIYTLPAGLIDIDSIAKRFGESVQLKQLKFQIVVAKPEANTLKVAENSAAKNGFTVMVPPLDFKVRVKYNDTEIEITRFKAFVERMIAIPGSVEPSKITTGVVIEPDGTVRHVPTKVVSIDGKTYAKVNSLTDSIYALVWHPFEFKDVANHWAKDAINDLGSRMVLTGNGDGGFNPNQLITRAEFTTIVVNALGLKQEGGNNVFKDVKSSDWFGSAVLTAHEYGLISGNADGKFRPNDRITREQAMSIISKAMALTGLKAKLPAYAPIKELLRTYEDAESASGWAVSGIADCLQAGIVSGRTASTLAPKSNITKAEVAVMIQRLLIKSDLI
ncbi:X2-like carbohydrate binding domain-containing protein [Paenibacillus harenae]|uniref:SLH domain-containing protein n=1 Tax=Paenibacillus harenae TaxID=306543 RepID=A0ABT9U9F0_PAEHA|nr:X2-like carbohydrate binding domain-containing protein [Paenibacillus harenae]MDQ0116208.1 hypothetical protein [Paenibacillus harenae]